MRLWITLIRGQLYVKNNDMNKNLTIFLIYLLRFIHFAVLIYVLTGWVFPEKTLFVYLLFIPSIILQWIFNDGTCVLTNAENFLRTDKTQEEKNEKTEKKAQRGQFLKGVARNLTGYEPSDRLLFWAVYLLLALFWAVAAARCFL